MGILIAFLVFSFIVFIHELGHFLLARKGGIGVEEFAIGMGPKLWSTKKGDTVYSIRLLPIGGFCAMLGEDSAGGGMSSDNKDETIDIATDPRAFNNRPLKDRFWAILAGPMFNFLLALVFAVILIFATGAVSTTVLDHVEPESPAYQAGLRNGDQLLAINGHRILDPLEASTYILVEQGRPVMVEVLREGQKKSFEVTPKEVERGEQKIYMIGIGYKIIEPNFFQTLYYAFFKFASMIKMTFFSLFALITGQVSLKMLSGPVGIVNALSKSYGTSMAIWQFIATVSGQIVLLSANLGIMNLLPIPALDGGRIVFLAVEAIRGKPIDPKKEGYIHLAGFVLLMLLMVIIFYTDIMKLIA
ncbi:RIP metalloprotease RseP [Clostridiales bacterium COT073_COT-073]|nr:RIP metalloprotease RseP [Clostridiales bacterium COT073_COT-073]